MTVMNMAERAAYLAIAKVVDDQAELIGMDASVEIATRVVRTRTLPSRMTRAEHSVALQDARDEMEDGMSLHDAEQGATVSKRCACKGRGAETVICSYWERQQFRDADDSLFAAMGDMPPGLAERMDAEQQQEDDADPQCGECEACLASTCECPSGCPECGWDPHGEHCYLCFRGLPLAPTLVTIKGVDHPICDRCLQEQK